MISYLIQMGTLFVVGTPIGNLKDISQRAIETLNLVDLILAEDTRKTNILLSAYKIKKPMESFYEQNENRKVPQIIQKLKAGQNIALLSDAGTPLISDPGYKLIRECARQSIKTVAIPGPSAVTASLSVSGLPTNQFIFLGFFPKKEAKQKQVLDLIEHLNTRGQITVVFFDSPLRIRKTLKVLSSKFPEKEIVLARELTKIHEEIIRGKVSEVLSKEFNEKGEFTILLG